MTIKTEQAKAAFNAIQKKANLTEAKDFLAVGAVMKFFEDVDEIIKANNNEELEGLKKQLFELQNNDEIESWRARAKDAEKKLEKAARLLKKIKTEKEELERKLENKEVSDFENAIELDSESIEDEVEFEDFDFGVE